MVLSKVEAENSKVKEEPKKENKKEIFQVVAKLPVQEIRQIEREDVIINLITIEEYLTQQANAGDE